MWDAQCWRTSRLSLLSSLSSQVSGNPPLLSGGSMRQVALCSTGWRLLGRTQAVYLGCLKGSLPVLVGLGLYRSLYTSHLPLPALPWPGL